MHFDEKNKLNIRHAYRITPEFYFFNFGIFICLRLLYFFNVSRVFSSIAKEKKKILEKIFKNINRNRCRTFKRITQRYTNNCHQHDV